MFVLLWSSCYACLPAKPPSHSVELVPQQQFCVFVVASYMLWALPVRRLFGCFHDNIVGNGYSVTPLWETNDWRQQRYPYAAAVKGGKHTTDH